MNARPALTRFRKNHRSYVATVLFMTLFLILLSTSITPSTKEIEDWTLKDLTKAIAAKNQLDPYLVMAIITTESHWKTNAISNAGALGLMQVMPEWIPKLNHLGIHSKKDLLNPEKNISAGCHVLKVHLSESSNSLPKALEAYSGKAKGYTKKVLLNYVSLERI